MNKLLNKPKTEPILHPSPDLKNRSKIQGTVSPVRQVKLFLQNAKQAHRQRNAMTLVPLEQKSRYSSTQQILRKRIDELQMENNQFRSLAKEYDLLVQKNRGLEAQMLLLLNQLEQGNLQEQDESHSLTQQRKAFTKEHNNTTQSSHQHSPTKRRNKDSGHFGRSSQSQEIKIVHPFDSNDEQDILQDNRRLRQENERVQERIESSIREAIAQLQQKFMAHVTALQEKLAALADNHKQAALIAAGQDSSKSSRENIRSGRERKDSESHAQSQRSGFSLNPRKTFDLEMQSRQREVCQSKVDINFSQLSESNMQYGRHSKSPSQNTPNSFFRNVQFIDSQMPSRPLFQENALEQALQQVSLLRKHLSASFTASDVQPYFKNLRHALEAQLRDILSLYFPASSLEMENSQLRKKVAELGAELGRGQFLRVQASASKGASQLYLQQSYYLSLQPQQVLEYEESKRKLTEVIEVVRNFNKDYRYMLSESGRGSLVLLSAHKEK